MFPSSVLVIKRVKLFPIRVRTRYLMVYAFLCEIIHDINEKSRQYDG